MTMRILLATDGSDDARAATAWLGTFPLPADAELRVVSAVNVPPSALGIPTVHEFQQSLREEAVRLAETARTALAPRFTVSQTHVADGDARQVILRAAEEWPADLVVLGARGLGAVAGFLLGSVSLGVARHVPCSVLVVKGPATTRPAGALVAIDASTNAAAAAAFLARLPLDPVFAVRLLGVVERPHYPVTTPSFATGMVRQAIDRMIDERRAALATALENAARSLAGVAKQVERQVVVGHPVDEIVAAAARGDVGLVVVGARGLGALQRMWLGSVSEGVLRHADRPVLIVKTKGNDSTP
jgi:nucleotide-binding universal stress UspA family protein